MTTDHLSRREALTRTGLLLGAAALGPNLRAADAPPKPATASPSSPFRFSLNTATIRGQKLGILKEIEIASQAGYDALEPWLDSIQDYLKSGGTLPELRKRAQDAGLTIESAISFPEWLVDDETRRAAGLERARRELDLVAQIGGRRLAAPPAGATNLPKLEFAAAVERYRALLEAGEQAGVVPQLELWGHSKNLNRLGECVAVAMETGHRHACVLADVYHLYKGGSAIGGLRLLGADAIQVVHMNDYPSAPPREQINDSYRVYPGLGTAPLAEILRALRATGGQKVLSLELFNRDCWAQDPLTVAKTGLAAMKDVVKRAGLA